MTTPQQPELPALPESVIRRIHDREAFIPDMVGLRDLWPEILKFGNAVAQAAVLADRESRIPDGWVLVPVEPTREMMEAAPSLPAIGALSDLHLLKAGWSMNAIQNRSRWSKMIAAAPSKVEDSHG